MFDPEIDTTTEINIINLQIPLLQTQYLKTMKALKLTLAITTIALFTGCAGLTDTSIDDEPMLNSAGNDQVVNQELPDFFNGGDQEDIIDVRPEIVTTTEINCYLLCVIIKILEKIVYCKTVISINSRY